MFPITPTQVRTLRSLDFVNVTGLPVRNSNGFEAVIESFEYQHGKYDSMGNRIVIYTMDGQVWLRMGHLGTNNEKYPLLRDLIGEICPNGNGVFVPCLEGVNIVDAVCENGEIIPASVLIMMRLSNPNETFGRQITASGIDGLPKPKVNVPLAKIT